MDEHQFTQAQVHGAPGYTAVPNRAPTVSSLYVTSEAKLRQSYHARHQGMSPAMDATLPSTAAGEESDDDESMNSKLTRASSRSSATPHTTTATATRRNVTFRSPSPAPRFAGFPVRQLPQRKASNTAPRPVISYVVPAVPAVQERTASSTDSTAEQRMAECLRVVDHIRCAPGLAPPYNSSDLTTMPTASPVLPRYEQFSAHFGENTHDTAIPVHGAPDPALDSAGQWSMDDYVVDEQHDASREHGYSSPYLTSPRPSPLTSDSGTSPDMTPYSEMGTPYMGVHDSPLIRDSDEPFLTGASLFGGVAESESAAAESMTSSSKQPTRALVKASPSSPALPSFDLPITRSGPVVPPSPFRPRGPTIGATGTRKNSTPASLIAHDAPTQRRTYLTPSATSRKAVPDAFAKKRAHSAAFGEDEPEPSLSEEEAIVAKRRQNTLAARASRKRKLEHQLFIEAQVETLTAERNAWRERALLGQAMLAEKGVLVTFDTPSQ